MSELPFVTVVVPCRNEERFIGMCLDSIVASDYPRDRMEVLVIDGMSEDRTRDIIAEYADVYPFIRVLDNPRKITPTALNTGINSAKGDVIVWMSSHNSYQENYITRCIEYMQRYEADNVGGVEVILARDNTRMGQAIAAALGHRFGVGNASYRLGVNEPKWVDTVFGGCYRKDVFDRVGLFNEGLVRGQDMEFNLRLKKAGGRTLLIPNTVTYYYARSDMKSFWKQNWNNGVWAILSFRYSRIMPVLWRHLVPLAFVGGLLGSAALALVSSVGLWMLIVIGGGYSIANLAASAHVAVREKDIRYLALMPVAFASLHLGYGLGSLWGLATILAHRVSKVKK